MIKNRKIVFLQGPVDDVKGKVKSQPGESEEENRSALDKMTVEIVAQLRVISQTGLLPLQLRVHFFSIA